MQNIIPKFLFAVDINVNLFLNVTKKVKTESDLTELQLYLCSKIGLLYYRFKDRCLQAKYTCELHTVLQFTGTMRALYNTEICELPERPQVLYFPKIRLLLRTQYVCWELFPRAKWRELEADCTPSSKVQLFLRSFVSPPRRSCYAQRELYFIGNTSAWKQNYIFSVVSTTRTKWTLITSVQICI